MLFLAMVQMRLEGGEFAANRLRAAEQVGQVAPGIRAFAGSWIGSFLLATGVLLGDTPSTPTLKSTPLDLRFSETEHDFGRVRGGELLPNAFTFTNTGPGAIEIDLVQTSCSCVELGRWPTRIGPGEVGAIPFQFHTVSYSGQVTETITVTGKGPEPVSVVLRLKADVWRPIEVRPAAAVFEYYPDDAARSALTVRIVSQIDEPLELAAPTSSHPALTAEVVPVVPGREFDLTVHVIPPPKLANIVGKLTMKTSSDAMPLLEVPVHVLAPAPVSLSPRTLRVPAGPLSASASQSVEIRGYAPDSLLLEAPVVNLTGASATLSEIKPGRHFILTVTLAPGFVFPAEGKAEVTLKSNHPQYPLVRIPLMVMPPSAPQATLTPNR